MCSGAQTVQRGAERVTRRGIACRIQARDRGVHKPSTLRRSSAFFRLFCAACRLPYGLSACQARVVSTHAAQDS